MHPGSDSMGAPVSFAQRRPNAPSLPQFELPPPHQQKYPYAVSGSQASHTPGSLTSVGNLLTPPSTIAGDGNSPSLTGLPSTSSATSVAPSYAHSAYAWSPQPQGNPSYPFQQPHNQSSYPQQRTYSPHPHQNVIRSSQPQPQDSHVPSSHYESSLPPYPHTAPMSAPATLATMGPPSHHHPSPQSHPGQLLSSGTSISSAPSPVHAQEPYRPPPTPQYYSHPPPNTPHHPGYTYSAGPSPSLGAPLSAGGAMTSRAQMSPASTGPPAPLSAPPIQQGYPGRSFSSGYQSHHGPHGPVLTNLANPGGPAMLVGNMPQGMMNFNSGHSANLQHMYNNNTHTPPQPAHNDRPFKCDQCPQSFNRNHDLKRHKRIHLAVKPFPCGHCDKSFSRKDALKRHILVKGCGGANLKVNADSKDVLDGIKETLEVKPILQQQP